MLVLVCTYKFDLYSPHAMLISGSIEKPEFYFLITLVIGSIDLLFCLFKDGLP